MFILKLLMLLTAFFDSFGYYSTEQEFLDVQQASNRRDIGCNNG